MLWHDWGRAGEEVTIKKEYRQSEVMVFRVTKAEREAIEGAAAGGAVGERLAEGGGVGGGY